jgi:hypothetical protein
MPHANTQRQSLFKNPAVPVRLRLTARKAAKPQIYPEKLLDKIQQSRFNVTLH